MSNNEKLAKEAAEELRLSGVVLFNDSEIIIEEYIDKAAAIIGEGQAELRGLLEETLTYLENIFGANPSDRLERIISKITAALDGKGRR